MPWILVLIAVPLKALGNFLMVKGGGISLRGRCSAQSWAIRLRSPADAASKSCVTTSMFLSLRNVSQTTLQKKPAGPRTAIWPIFLMNWFNEILSPTIELLRHTTHVCVSSKSVSFGCALKE